MTRPPVPAEPDPNAGARFVEKLLDEDPAHLDVATDDEVDRMMDAAGVEVGEPESVEEALARGARRAKEREALARGARGEGAAAEPARDVPRRKPRPRTAWAAAAVAAAGVAAIATVEGRAIVSYLEGKPADIGPDRPGPAPSPEQQASLLRDEAITACHAGDMTACRTKLDEAKALDPAGETDPRVVAVRALLPTEPGPAPAPSKPRDEKPPRP